MYLYSASSPPECLLPKLVSENAMTKRQGNFQCICQNSMSMDIKLGKSSGIWSHQKGEQLSVVGEGFIIFRKPCGV